MKQLIPSLKMISELFVIEDIILAWTTRWTRAGVIRRHEQTGDTIGYQGTKI